MTPDQLKYLTDEERRAWEACGAATPGPWDDELDTDRKAERNNWREVYAGNRPVVVSDCYERHSAGETETVCGVRVSAPDAALIALSRTALPAALEALADARRERDEARAQLANAMGVISSLEGQLSGEAIPVAHGSFMLPATPGGEPASRGAGAPDASGGASGVGALTNCDSCRWNRIEDNGDETCDNPDEGHIGDGIAWWSTENCGARFKCRPGATGCPGWAMRGEG